jgi:hypothetical protein
VLKEETFFWKVWEFWIKSNNNQRKNQNKYRFHRQLMKQQQGHNLRNRLKEEKTKE